MVCIEQALIRAMILILEPPLFSHKLHIGFLGSSVHHALCKELLKQQFVSADLERQ